MVLVVEADFEAPAKTRCWLCNYVHAFLHLLEGIDGHGTARTLPRRNVWLSSFPPRTRVLDSLHYGDEFGMNFAKSVFGKGQGWLHKS
jgi:hypothetical protein